MLAIWLALAVISAVILVGVQRNGHEELESRFQLRTELTADFVETFVADFLRQEGAAAERVLSEREPSQRDFELVVTSLDSQAALLLDSEGHDLRVVPEKNSFQGKDLSKRYPHLASALAGEPAVSNVVPSASEGIPIVAFATPFGTPYGDRVFSAAFDIRSTPLVPYLGQAAVIGPNRAYLVDEAGVVLATNDAESLETSEMPADVAKYASTSTAGTSSSSEEFVVSLPVKGTPWQLVMTTPESFLFQPVNGATRIVPWLVWFGFIAGGLLTVWLVSRLLHRREKLTELNVLLDVQANMDSLTGIANRRRIEEEMEREIKRAKRDGEDLSVLIVDVDRFKEINDTCGHRTGDDVLRGVSKALAVTLRDTDVLGRWGGDEFLIGLPRIDAEGAAMVAGRINDRVRETSFVDESGVVQTTVSIGCATWGAEEDVESLVHRADGALYAAKAEGRDRFEVAEASEQPAKA